MKNIQLVEPAENCAFLVHSVSEKDFKLVFPAKGQDIEFVEDLLARLGKRRAGQVLSRLFRRYVDKQQIHGIHGTLFLMCEGRKQYFPNKRETDLDGVPRGRPPLPARQRSGRRKVER
jgi:hypothetical protein